MLVRPQGPGKQDSCPGGPLRAEETSHAMRGRFFRKQSETPTGWKFTTTANPPEYSTAYSEGFKCVRNARCYHGLQGSLRKGL